MANAATTTPATEYPPMTMAELAEELALPLSQRGQPDFESAVPRRLVSKAEAEARGLAWLYEARACRYSHQAARRTSNDRICSDCLRSRKGLPTVYPQSRAQDFYPEPRRKPKDAPAPIVIAAPAPAAPLALDVKDQKTIEAIAQHGSIAAAATALKTTAAAIEARRASNPTFADALGKLEANLDIKRVLPAPVAFEWTPEIERKLIDLWVNSGSLSAARDGCAMTASQYYEHLESSDSFQEAVDKARPLAASAIQERVVQIALGGNPALLSKYVPNQEQEDPNSKLTNEQLAEKIEQQLRWLADRGMLRIPGYELVKRTALPAPADAQSNEDLV